MDENKNMELTPVQQKKVKEFLRFASEMYGYHKYPYIKVDVDELLIELFGE